MRQRKCPRCHGARMIHDREHHTDIDRFVCPLCGESEWLNFRMIDKRRA